MLATLTLKDLESHPILSLGNKSRYSCYQLVFPENVAEHTCNVSILALVLARYFNLLEGKEVADIRDAVYRGVVHDIGEAYTADVVLNIKNSSSELKRLIGEYENKVMSQDKLLDNTLRNDINTAKDPVSMGGVIITLADRFDALLKIEKEHNTQFNRTIRTLYMEVIASALTAINEALQSGVLNSYPNIINYLINTAGEILEKIDAELDFFSVYPQKEAIKVTMREIIDVANQQKFNFNKFRQLSLITKLGILT